MNEKRLFQLATNPAKRPIEPPERRPIPGNHPNKIHTELPREKRDTAKKL
jgi:hypothetical protein